MKKSFVGDPVLWPGLVYAPLNNAGLVFALGTIVRSTGLILEEFADDFRTAICRRKTDFGWERINVAFALRSSLYDGNSEGIDLLVCWVDDAPEVPGPIRLVLSRLLTSPEPAEHLQEIKSPGGLDSILPENAAEDLLERARSHQSYEETVRMLDEQIKKLQGG